MKFIIYDFEVFKNDWMVVCKYTDNPDHIIIINDADKLRTFYEDNKNNIFVGYNNKHFDDFLLKGILSGLSPQKITKWIVFDEKNGWKFPGYDKSIRFVSLDLMDDITGAVGISLKEIESNLGMSIEESSIPFDIDRSLTEDEIKETIKYCTHDVDATEKLMSVRSDYIKSKFQLINTFKLPLSNLSMTNAQLTAEVMSPRVKQYDDWYVYDVPSELQLKDTSIMEMYSTPLDVTKKKEVLICGVPHILGFGGLHGATECSHYKDNIYNFDVASYYPSLIIKFGYQCRGIKDPNKYKQIYDQRICYKKSGDPRAAAYKLVLNTFFGAMGYEYNKLYDPKQNHQVCITGQLFLIDLLEKLKPYITLIQSNTDGIMFQTYQIDKCREIINEWQKRTTMNMEEDTIKEVYQKDVNNYFILKDNGEIKSKGGYVKNYGIEWDKSSKSLKEHYGNFVSNTMSILDEAIVKNLLYKTPVEDIIYGCNDPIRFQITTKKGPTYKRVEYEVDNVLIEANKVNRVFATKSSRYGKLFKVKQNGRKDTIASLPEHCLVFNKDLSEFDISLVDKEWYINVAKSKICDFMGKK